METGVFIKLGRAARMPLLAIAAGSFGLTACTIEMGPPPESDPPLVAESQKRPPPPPQPTEPQAWSKDLDFDAGGELSVSRQQMAEGLVAADEDRAYSSERLTFESAESSERPPSAAELIREKARQRLLEAQAASAGASAQVTPAIAPPQVVAAPVEAVSAEALPEQSPLPEQSQSVEMPEQPLTTAAAPIGTPDRPDEPVAEAPQQADTPPAANLAPAEKLTGSSGAPVSPEAEQVAALALEPWDAPDGTILVQVSAIQDRQQIAREWERLKQGYPKVFAPLRLVVDEAKLGDRGVFFRVQAGGFASKQQAQEACSTLTDQGQSCFVVERAVDG